jgi:DNA-directed RNA polymerase subunit RPC12/RpoP
MKWQTTGIPDPSTCQPEEMYDCERCGRKIPEDNPLFSDFVRICPECLEKLEIYDAFVEITSGIEYEVEDVIKKLPRCSREYRAIKRMQEILKWTKNKLGAIQ